MKRDQLWQVKNTREPGGMWVTDTPGLSQTTRENVTRVHF